MTVAAVVLGAAMIFGRLGELPLIDPDEGRNVAVAREMEASGAWLVPTLGGVPYLDKPALYFRLAALSMTALGPGEAAARLPSAMSAAALLAVLFAFCRRTYGARTAALALLVLATTPLVIGFARVVIFDMPLALCTTVAILAGYRAEADPGAGPGSRQARGWTALAAVAAGVATLLKGPVGFLVPLLVLAAFHLVERRPAAIRRLLAPVPAALFLAVVLPWFLALVRAHPAFLSYGLLHESVGRYFTPALRRGEPVYYYGPLLLLALFPWSLLLPEAALAIRRTFSRWRAPDRLLLVWALVVILFFSASQSKRPGYILPAVIALAVLLARLLDRALADDTGWAGRLVLRSAGGLAGVAMLAAAALSVNVVDPGRLQAVLGVRSEEFDRLQPAWGPFAAILLATALVALLARVRRRVTLAVVACCVPAVLTLTAGFGAVARVTEAASSRPLARAMPPLPAGALVACLECYPAGVPFYLGRPVTYVTEHARALTSNYVRYLLRRGAPWPPSLVHLDDREAWLARQTVPVLVLSEAPARSLLVQMADRRGRPVEEILPGWWAALLPPGAGS